MALPLLVLFLLVFFGGSGCSLEQDGRLAAGGGRQGPAALQALAHLVGEALGDVAVPLYIRAGRRRKVGLRKNRSDFTAGQLDGLRAGDGERDARRDRRIPGRSGLDAHAIRPHLGLRDRHGAAILEHEHILAPGRGRRYHESEGQKAPRPGSETRPPGTQAGGQSLAFGRAS